VLRKVVVLAGLLMMGSLSYGADLVKVGYVDVQKVLETCTEGKEARRKLDKMVKAREEVLLPDKKAIDALNKELEEQLLMREELRRQKQIELQDKIRLFETKRQRAFDDVKLEEQKLTQPILSRVNDVIAQMGVEDGYTVIFEKNYSSLLFASEQIDLTDNIIRQLDEKYNR